MMLHGELPGLRWNRRSAALGLLIVVTAILCFVWPAIAQVQEQHRRILVVLAVVAAVVLLTLSAPTSVRQFIRSAVVTIVVVALFAGGAYLVLCQRVAELAVMPDGGRVCAFGRIGDGIRIAKDGDGRTAVFTLSDWSGSVRCVTKTGPPPPGGWVLVAGEKRTYKGETVIVADFRLANFLRGVPRMTKHVETREYLLWRPGAPGDRPSADIELEVVAALATDWCQRKNDAAAAETVGDSPSFSIRRYQSLSQDGSVLLVSLTGTEEQIREAVERFQACGLEVAAGDEPMRQHEGGE